MTVFTNFSGISIPDGSSTSQTLQVGGLTGTVTRLSVTIAGLTHLLQDQLDLLLVAPDGTHNLVFWSDAGGPNVVAGANVTAADAGASPLPASTTVVGGTTYQPADYDVAEVGATFGSPLVALNHATTNGTATFASAFNTIDPNGIWTLYAADDTVGGTGSITSWSLDFAVGGAMIVDGTSNADTLVINATGPDSGTYVLNGGPAIDLIGVTSFTFNGGDGNDSVTINNPAGGLFGPAGGIFINGGAQTGPPGDSLTLAGGSAGQATFSFGPTPDAGTIASADQEVQRIALGGAGSGSFSLTFNGQTTAQLSAAATAAAVQAALNALSSIGGAGGSVVAVQSGTTFMITFGGSLAGIDVPQMTATGTGGTTVGVTTLNDGSAAAQSITYTGLDPIDMTGSTVTDLVFILPSSADQAVFDDDGVPLNNFSRLRSNNGTFETTVFAHPASSLTLNAGAGDSVAVDFLDPLGTADLTVGSLGNAALRPDSIAIDNVVTAGTVNLGAAGAIAQPGFDGGAPDITASAAAFVAGAGIGTFSQSLDLQVATVAARNIGSGIVNFNNSGPLAIGTVNGLVGITATNGVSINEIGGGSAGSLTVASDVHSLVGSVSLRAIGPGSMFTSNAAISAGGNITLAADRMALAGGSASAGGTFRTIFLGPVTPGSTIDLGSQTDAAAGTLELSDAELDTVSTPSLRVGGGITGNITISSPLSGSGHYGSLGLACVGAIVDATASEQVDLTVPVLTLDAAGIGASDDLDTAVGRLVFFNRGGAVNISNTGPLTLAALSFNDGTTTTVSTSSPLLLDGFVTSVGDLTLTAGDSAASGDNLTIGVVGGSFVGSHAASSSGSVFLSAGDDFILNPLSSIVAAGVIEITVDAGNADPGVGGTADLRPGTLTAGIAIVVNGQGDGDTLLGGAAGESFFGGGGDDLIAGGGGNNALDGGPGSDTADYSAAPGAVVINVATGGSNGYGGTDAFGSIQNVNGSAFADTLTGDGNANVFRGNGGNDLLVGGADSDTAAYSGNAADYRISFLPGIDMRITDLRAGSPDGTDALSAFEALQFANGTMPIVFGTSGSDSFAAQSGLEAINALGGSDTITFNFRLVDATVTYDGNTVTIDGPATHTVLAGFETFVFTDGTVENGDGDHLVDDLFYYSHSHDVWNAHADADQHYHGFGWHELRDPNAFFSTFLYRAAYPNVSAAGVDPLVHFDQTGWIEGRVPSLAFDPRQYLAAYPDVAAAHVDPLLHYLAFGYQEGREPFAPAELIGANGFDYVWYLNHNPDVAAAHVDPLQHFQAFGWQEGRNPNALFDTAGYLATYADVAAAHVNPLEHYNQFGWHEGRDPSVGFDTTAYLAAYPDVAAAGVNPLLHFLQFGQHEGRSAFADGTWG